MYFPILQVLAVKASLKSLDPAVLGFLWKGPLQNKISLFNPVHNFPFRKNLCNTKSRCVSYSPEWYLSVVFKIIGQKSEVRVGERFTIKFKMLKGLARQENNKGWRKTSQPRGRMKFFFVLSMCTPKILLRKSL